MKVNTKLSRVPLAFIRGKKQTVKASGLRDFFSAVVVLSIISATNMVTCNSLASSFRNLEQVAFETRNDPKRTTA